MELCILIPAKNEAMTLPETVFNIYNELDSKVSFNCLVINDHSDDNSLSVLKSLSEEYDTFSFVNNEGEGGVGNAIRYGLNLWKGDIITICMADGSDSPKDILSSYNLILSNKYDCVFGSRFIPGALVKRYPKIKLLLNRIFNNLVKSLTAEDFNDFTNLFKTYSRMAIETISPLDSEDFNIGLEMSLKAFQKKLKIAIIPISWEQRTAGKSKLNLRKNIPAYIQTLYKIKKFE